MKKFVVLFVALTFFAAFSVIGCNQSQPPAKPAAEKGVCPLCALMWGAGSTGSTGRPLQRLRQREPLIVRLREIERAGQATGKGIDAGYRGISSPTGSVPPSLKRPEGIERGARLLNVDRLISVRHETEH